MQKLRARNSEDKEARRESILAAALEMWEEVAYPDFTMSALAARLGLAKGTLYLYFPTKEELFLTVFERLLGEWLDELEKQLSRGRWGAQKLAAHFARSLASRPRLARMFPLLESILERNISAEKALAYKSWLLVRAAPVALALERHLSLRSGAGIKALAYTQALVTGLQQMTDNAPAVRRVLQKPGLRVLQMEFEADAGRALAALFGGMQTAGKERP